MDKAVARAKFRKGARKRLSHGRRPPSSSQALGSSPSVVDDDNNNVWGSYDDVLRLDELANEDEDENGLPKPRSKGLDYAELLAQDPLYNYGGVGGADPYGDSFLDIYSNVEDPQTTMSTAALLSLDLENLRDCFSKVSLARRLFLDDQTLPSELLAPRDSLVSDDENAEMVESVQQVGNDQQQSVSAVNEWLNVAVHDPDDGQALRFTVTEEELAQATTSFDNKAAEEELDELLNMLGSVSIASDKYVEQEPARGLDIGAFVMPEKDLEALFWAPGSPESTSTASIEKKNKAELPVEEDFDAWLDSLN